MMGKVNLDKLKSFDPVRPERQADVKGSRNEPIRQALTGKAANDRVDLSGRAAEVGKLVTQIKELPEVRADKVESVRATVASGEFDPAAGDVADAIIRDESN